MKKGFSEIIIAYLQKIKAANKELTKKELFKDLLHRLYPGESEIQSIIDAISAGAEKTIYFPKFDDNNKVHQQLAAFSQTAHEKASSYIAANPPQQELSAMHLGRLRVAIKKHLAEEMKGIDGLVKKLIG